MQLLISEHNSCSFKSCPGELCRAITTNEDTERDCVAVCFDTSRSPYVQVVSVCQLGGLETAQCVLSSSCCRGCDTQYLENLFASTVSQIFHPWLYKLSAYVCRFDGSYQMKTKFLWNVKHKKSWSSYKDVRDGARSLEAGQWWISATDFPLPTFLLLIIFPEQGRWIWCVPAQTGTSSGSRWWIMAF